MRIVADDAIAGAAAWFAPLGEVQLLPGRTLSRAQLAEAEVLLVRSVTRVDQGLLEGTRVRFVGSATAGVDHVDRGYLLEAGIAFASAPGCNATAVAEYVLACVLAHARMRHRPLSALTVGIIGHGHTGQAVQRLLQAVGATCLLNDPPRQEAGAGPAYVALEEVLTADVISLHVPLESSGPHPTRELVNARRIAALPHGALLINAARGGVVDEAAWLARAGDRALAVDCWAGEPCPDWNLVQRAFIATPHIAGHTVEARWRASAMLAEALARWSGRALPSPATGLARIPLRLEVPPAEVLAAAVSACCDPVAMTKEFRASCGSAANGAGAFDALRRKLGARREFSVHRLEGIPPAAREGLGALGFECLA